MMINRLKLLIPTCIVALTTSQAGSSAELLQVLIDCRALPSAVARLDCYDQLVDARAGATRQVSGPGAVREPSPSAVVPAATTATTAAAEPKGDISPEALFGKSEEEVRTSVQEATGRKKLEQIEARISKVITSNTGHAIITLDNGQVWKQTDRLRLRLSEQDEVIISRGIFGSYKLVKAGRNTTIRVRRIS